MDKKEYDYMKRSLDDDVAGYNCLVKHANAIKYGLKHELEPDTEDYEHAEDTLTGLLNVMFYLQGIIELKQKDIRRYEREKALYERQKNLAA